MRFQPSQYSYGEAVEPTAEEPPKKKGVQDYLQYIPLVRELVAGEDPEVEASKVRSLLKQKKKTLREQPWQGILLKPQIASLEGKLQALDIQAGEARSSAQMYQAGQAFTLVGLGVGVFILVGGAYWVFQKGQLVKAERKALA